MSNVTAAKTVEQSNVQNIQQQIWFPAPFFFFWQIWFIAQNPCTVVGLTVTIQHR